MIPLAERTRGRWRGILPTLGVPTGLLDGKHHPCPFCNAGKDRFRFTDFNGTGGFICNQCGNGSGIDFLMRFYGWDFKTTAQKVEGIVGKCEHETKPKRSEADFRAAMNRIWRQGKAISAFDPVGKYLYARCRLREYPASLRYVPVLWHQSKKQLPAMIAKVMCSDGKPCQVWRTYLDEHGRKADVDPVRAPMPGTIPKGAAIRLAPIVETLGIAEGIETALSAAALTGIPCWSAMTANGLASWQAPAGVKSVVIFADNDANFTGQAAAYDLAKRLARDGVSARIEIPEGVNDWNDVQQEKSNALAKRI